jgi:hypothetical protein
VKAELAKVAAKIPKEQGFDAVFAVDQYGRVVAHLGYEQATGMEDFELGGYPVVADALHGFIRDDTLLLDRLYRVVARPVELDLGSMPAGAIVGARIVDDRFARDLSQRTGAAVAFYANGQRVAAGAPEGFDTSQLDQIVSDLSPLESDKDYQEKGRSDIRTVGGVLGVVYARLPGEAWHLGAGYAVARLPSRVDDPFTGFFRAADDKDKKSASLATVALVALLGAGLGLLFTLFEHTRPLHTFRVEAHRMSKNEVDQLQPSKFRGVYRKIASDLNDGIDHVAAKGGAPRRAADLKQVLGEIPDQPSMSAFSFPGDPASAPAPLSSPSNPRASAPSNPPLPAAPALERVATGPRPGSAEDLASTQQSSAGPAPQRRPPPRAGGAEDEASEWQRVYEEFVAAKQQCGENVDGFTYQKFEQTLKKNRDALIQRHGCKRVKFSVYVKEGKAALKASPIKE